MLHGQALDFVVVDQPGSGVQAVLHGVVQLAGGGHLGAVGEMAAVGQAHAEDGVAGVEQRQVHRGVGRGTGMRLDVGVVGAEQLPGAVDGQLLDLVDVFAAAVVALARIALGIFVGQAALRLHDPLAGVVLRGDQFEMVFLAGLFGVHRGEQFVVVAADLVMLAEHRWSCGAGTAPEWLQRDTRSLCQRWYDRPCRPRCLCTPREVRLRHGGGIRQPMRNAPGWR